MQNSVKARLNDLLKSTGMSANELARVSQVDYTTVYRILSGETLTPSRKTLEPIAQVLKVNVDWLRKGQGDKAPAVTEASLLERALQRLEDQLQKKDDLIDKLTTLLMGKHKPTKNAAYLMPTGSDGF